MFPSVIDPLIYASKTLCLQRHYEETKPIAVWTRPEAMKMLFFGVYYRAIIPARRSVSLTGTEQLLLFFAGQALVAGPGYFV